MENAIYHGIKARRGPGTIWIEAKAEDDKLLLTVRDDGAGMTADRLRELREWLEIPLEAMEVKQKQKGVSTHGRSYGMLNVQARIRLSFGEEYGIVLESKEGTGTCVTITHPLLLDMARLKKPYEKGEGQDDEIKGHTQLDNGESD
ncbi:Histidine kinase-, DNA gyrase B-, and HSP90-like ATPase [compost metagenome]